MKSSARLVASRRLKPFRLFRSDGPGQWRQTTAEGRLWTATDDASSAPVRGAAGEGSAMKQQGTLVPHAPCGEEHEDSACASSEPTLFGLPRSSAPSFTAGRPGTLKKQPCTRTALHQRSSSTWPLDVRMAWHGMAENDPQLIRPATNK